MGFREVGIYEKHAQARRPVARRRDRGAADSREPSTVNETDRPTIISLVAIVAGLVLFVVTMLGIDRAETLIEARSLGAGAAAGAAAEHRLAPAARRRLVCLLSARRAAELLADLPRAAGGRRRRLLHDSRRRQRAAARRAADGPRLAGRQRRRFGPRAHGDGHHERGRRRHLRRLRGVVRHAAASAGRTCSAASRSPPAWCCSSRCCS